MGRALQLAAHKPPNEGQGTPAPDDRRPVGSHFAYTQSAETTTAEARSPSFVRHHVRTGGFDRPLRLPEGRGYKDNIAIRRRVMRHESSCPAVYAGPTTNEQRRENPSLPRPLGARRRCFCRSCHPPSSARLRGSETVHLTGDDTKIKRGHTARGIDV